MKEQIRTIWNYIQEAPLLIASLSMSWNLVFAVINGIYSLMYSSWWYLTLFAMYLLLALMKFGATTLPKSRRRTEAGLLLHNGIAMFFLAVILCGLMVLTIRELHNPVQSTPLIVITAAYTFVFIGLTIYNTIQAHLR